MAEHACSEMGRAAAQRSSHAPSGRVQMRGPKIWGPNTRGLSDFIHIPGVYRIFVTYRGFIGFSSTYRGLSIFLLHTGGLSDPPLKIRGFISSINPGFLVPRAYHVSQKQNGFNNKIHTYSILVTFMFRFMARLAWTKIFVPSNLSKDAKTTRQY